MRRLLACLSAVAMTGTLAAPAATSAGRLPDRDDSRLPSRTAAVRSVHNPVARSAVLSTIGARAAGRTATWSDPADGPIPERDLRRLAVEYNASTGKIAAKFRLGAHPTRATRAFAVMYLGVLRNGTCHARAAVGGRSDRGKSAWIRIAADGSTKASGDGSATHDGRTVKLHAKARPLRGRAWHCAYAYLHDLSDNSAYDSTGYARMQAPPRAKLELSTPDTRTQTSAAVGHWTRVKVEVENDGETKARGVRVRVSEPKGVQVKPRTLSFKPIKVDRERTKSVRIKLTKRSKRTVKLKATAKNAGSRKGRLVIHPKPKPLQKNLVGRYFWGFKSHVSHAWDNYAIAFVSKKHAYVGFPKRGVPKDCRPSSTHCVRYSYNKRTGKLKVGGRRGHYRNGNLTLGGIDTYTPTKLPKPGKRWTVILVHNGYAMCPGVACTTWTDWLELRRDGSFEVGGQMLGRVAAKGEPGIPSGEGHYRIRRGGHLVLNYKNDKTRHTTIAISTDGQRRPDVYGEGLFINGTNFYP